MRIETERQAVVDLPGRIEADGFERIRLLAKLLLVAHILAGQRLVVVDRRGDRTIVEDDMVGTRAVREPECPLASVFPCVDFGKRVVGRQCEALDRCILHRELRVRALAVPIGIAPAEIVRPGVELAIGRRILDRRADRAARIVRPGVQVVAVLGDCLRIPDADVPIVLVRTGDARVAFGVARREADAEAPLLIGPVKEAGDFGGNVVSRVVRRVMKRLGGHLDLRFMRLERPQRLDVDRCADAAACDACPARLEDFDAAHAFGSEIREIERARRAAERAARAAAAPVGEARRHRAPVQGDHVVGCAEAAHRDLGALAVHPIDRNARDSLQGFRQVGIGKFAHVLGGDRIDDAQGFALDIHRPHQRASDAGDDDLLERTVAFGGQSDAACARHCPARNGGREQSFLKPQFRWFHSWSTLM